MYIIILVYRGIERFDNIIENNCKFFIIFER